MKYVFQRSKIWETGNPIDASSKPVRKKRVWILINIEGNT